MTKHHNFSQTHSLCEFTIWILQKMCPVSHQSVLNFDLDKIQCSLP